MADRYDILQPYHYQKGDEEKTGWERVGAAFPRKDKETGRVTGFVLRFNASPPYPETLMLAEPKPKPEKAERRKSDEPDLDNDISF